MAVVQHLRPRAVLVENVPDLPSWDDGSVLMGFYESLKDLGYTSMPACLTPSSTACPSTGPACSSSACGTDARSNGPNRAARSRPCATRSVTCRRCRRRSARNAHSVLRGPRSPFQRRMREGAAGTAASIHDHITRDVRPDDAEAFALLERGRPTWICPCTSRYRSDIFTDKYKRLGVGRGEPEHHGSHRQGRLLVHPSPAAPNALRSRGRASPDVPRTGSASPASRPSG